MNIALKILRRIAEGDTKPAGGKAGAQTGPQPRHAASAGPDAGPDASPDAELNQLRQRMAATLADIDVHIRAIQNATREVLRLRLRVEGEIVATAIKWEELGT